MKTMNFIVKGVLVVLLPAAVLLSAADTPPATVKGYVLDSACAFTKGLSKPISKAVRDFVRQGRVATCDSLGGRNHLLANCRLYSLQRSKP